MVKIEKNSIWWKVIDKTCDVIIWSFVLLVTYIALSIFVFSTFKIPTDSMYPALQAGDNVVVFKPTIGARLFNLFATLDGGQTKIHRAPGFRKVRRNDILIFNYPHPNSWEKIEMHILKYYAKRCIAIPGDTLRIENGHYHIQGYEGPLGNLDAQERIAHWKETDIPSDIFRCHPSDSMLNWNIKDFGPLYVPRKGGIISMDRRNFLIYRKLIAFEQQAEVTFQDGTVYIGGRTADEYRFEKDYYFVSGDRTENSQDSRYWGLLPEEYIVGVGWMVWYASDPTTGRTNWKRCLHLLSSF